jgi:hypothetical protein
VTVKVVVVAVVTVKVVVVVVDDVTAHAPQSTGHENRILNFSLEQNATKVGLSLQSDGSSRPLHVPTVLSFKIDTVDVDKVVVVSGQV